jgi:histidine triad (HIT) family protein
VDDCIFCKIVKGEIPCKKVYEDEHNLAFLDINPRNPGHTVLISKTHADSLFTIGEDDAVAIMKALRRVAIGVRKATNAGGVSIAQSNGHIAGQRTMHIHFHVIPRTEAEKGIGLEEFLPVKKRDEASMASMARKISDSIPRAAKPEPLKEEPEEKKTPEAGRPESPEKQDIRFDF